MRCEPGVENQVALPDGPEFAVTLIDWPAPSELVTLSDQVTRLPSMRKATPILVPAGVARLPSFVTMAEKVTALPEPCTVGVHWMFVTVRSMPMVIGTTSLLLFSLVSLGTRLMSSTQASKL